MQQQSFLGSNVYAGQHPNLNIGFLHKRKPLHWFIRPGLPQWFRDRNSQLLHLTGNSTLVLLTGKATLLPSLFFALHKQDSASGSFKLQFALNLRIQFPWCTSLRSALTEEYHLSRVVSDYLAFAHHAFGFMYFGDLWNFLDLLHRFCKSPQLVLTQLLQCSIAHRAPSKTFIFLNRTKSFSAGIFAIIKPRRATLLLSSSLRTCKLFMPQRGSILHFNLFSLLLTVACLRLAVRTQTVAD